MKAPYSWIKQYIDTDLGVQDYAKRMIATGTAVEGIDDISAEVSGVVAGRVEKIEKHPDSDHLQICQVNVGSEVLQIVTGAPNVREGMVTPVALNGAHLPGGIVIHNSKLRGVPSYGMMCSGPELGVPVELYPSVGEHGLLEILEDVPLGTDVRDILGINDQVIDFEILANRPDCLSILGLARESAAVLGTKTHIPEAVLQEKGTGRVEEEIEIRVDNSTLCPRYMGAVVKNIRIAPSPMWMRKALFAAGVRPINNIVDITNYVMLEYGQPMHAFDLSTVRGRKIIVRNAEEGEVLRTLDGKDRTLTPQMLVIADAEGATGLAGVMGGENSEIESDTAAILFECAVFHAANIRQTSRALGLRTEASGRYEHGVNINLTPYALRRALALVEELDAGDVVPGIIDLYPNPKKKNPIVAPISRLYTQMGIEIPVETMIDLLNGLGIRTVKQGDALVCESPEWRQDLDGYADIAEEVLRLYGYDKLPSTLFHAETVVGSLTPRIEDDRIIRQLLTGAGLYEAVTYSFVSPRTLDQLNLDAEDPLRQQLRILNPLGEDYSVMRTTLIPSMIQTLLTNISRSNPGGGFFEIGKCFLPKALPLTELPEERPVLCIGMYGEGTDFFTVKGIIDAILCRFGVKGEAYARAKVPYLHPGRSAEVLVGGKSLALLGQLHPDVQNNFGLPVDCVVAQLDLVLLRELSTSMAEAQALPRFQSVERDLALVMDEDTPAGYVSSLLKKSCGELCENVDVFDVYRGIGVQSGKKSVAYKLTLRSSSHTLTEQEISEALQKAMQAAEEKFGAVLRR